MPMRDRASMMRSRSRSRYGTAADSCVGRQPSSCSARSASGIVPGEIGAEFVNTTDSAFRGGVQPDARTGSGLDPTVLSRMSCQLDPAEHRVSSGLALRATSDGTTFGPWNLAWSRPPAVAASANLARR